MGDELTLISGGHRAQLKGFLQSKGLQLLPRGQVQSVACFYMAGELRMT